MKRKLACLMALVLVLVLGNSALAAVAPGEDFYYLDTANVLSTEAEGAIYFCNQLLEEACGGQIVVAALDNLDGADTYDYAYELFNEWGIGSAEENNGFLLLMAIQEDDYYALAGSGVEGIFSSSELKSMFDKYLEPDFAKKDYEAGALKFFEAVLDKYIDRYNLNFSYEDGEAKAFAYIADGGSASDYGGASSGGGSHGSAYGVTSHGEPYDYYYEEEDGLSDFAIAVIVIVLIFIFSGINSRRRGGSFWFFMGPGWHHHHHHGPHRPPRHHNNRRPPRSGGGFGGGFGGGGRSGGFGGGFGGGRG
ncbi:MAG: TPM domain-containing protein, partial [Clostridia bacterium]|nr:TPM domain-containing protein [Clostridia bacterium]